MMTVFITWLLATGCEWQLSSPRPTPPLVSNGQPTGNLAAGTTETPMSVTTNEAATCKWGTASSTAYPDLANTFTTTGGTSHATTLTGLADGQSYTRYVRCQDGAGNANTSSYAISFSVASPGDVTPPVVTNGQPTGTLPAGTTQTPMSVTTNEAATCKWGTASSTAYPDLANTFTTTGGTSHATTLTGLADGQSYTRYVRCQDGAGNANTTSHTISFSVASPGDVTPPVISNGQPSGTLPAGTTQATMSVATDEAATCKWGTADAAYADLPNTFTTTGGTAHSTTLTGLADGQSYTRFVRCRDGTGNANGTSYPISFSVASGGGGSPVVTRVGTVFRLDGVDISRFGLRAVNALQSDEITDRFIGQLSDMRQHGMQSISVGLQGGRATEGGNSATNAYNSDGTLRSAEFARLGRVLDALAAEGMVAVVTMFYRGRDEELSNDDAVRRAVRLTTEFLQPWRHVWLYVINEPGHSGYDREILISSSGQQEIYQIIKGIDPERITFVSNISGANDGFDVHTAATESNGDVAVEYVRQDSYDNPGVFSSSQISAAQADAETTVNGGGYWFWHAAWHQKADAAGWPRFDKGGAGTSTDPGVTSIWDRIRLLSQP